MLFSISLNVFILFIHFSLLDNPLCKNNINDISNIEGPRGQRTGPINQANDRSILATHTKQNKKTKTFTIIVQGVKGRFCPEQTIYVHI